MVESELEFRRPWLALEGPFLSFFNINGLRNELSHHVRPPFLVFKAHFSTPGWHFLGTSTENSFLGRYQYSHVSA